MQGSDVFAWSLTDMAYWDAYWHGAIVNVKHLCFSCFRSQNISSERGQLLLTDVSSSSLLSLSVGSVWVNSSSVSDPCLPVSGHKDSGTCTDGGQEVGFSGLHR